MEEKKSPFSRVGVVFTDEQKRLIKGYFNALKNRRIYKISIIIFIVIVFISLFLVTDTHADTELKENDYQGYFAEWIEGETEVLLDDWSRVDILTEVYAIEIDYCYKWAEGIGQALFYAEKTGRLPGVVLILAKRKNYENYINRIMLVADKYNIVVWTITESFVITQVNFPGGERAD